MSKERKKPIPKRTVAKKLHSTWLNNKKKKDAENICIFAKENGLSWSKPTVEKALLYGHVLDDNLKDLITRYFEERNTKELGQANKLKNL